MKEIKFLVFLGVSLLAFCFFSPEKDFLVSSASAATSTSDVERPSTPVITYSQVISSTQINIYWATSTDNIGVTGYQIFRNGNFIATTTNQYYYNIDLNPSTTYNFQIIAFDAARNFSFLSNAEVVTTNAPRDSEAPTIPGNLSATVISSSQINLSWTASTDNSGIVGYRIYRGGSFLATSTLTSYSDTGLSASTQYAYTVLAFDAARNLSSQSVSCSATTLGNTDSQAPTTPSNLSATAISSTRINLSWTASNDNIGIAGYRILRDGYAIATTTNSTSYDNSALTPAKTYSYSVMAFDAAHNFSPQSARVLVTTKSLDIATSSKATSSVDYQSPSVPLGLSGIVISSSQINLSWAASTDNVGVVGYRVYRNGLFVATSSFTGYSNIGLMASTTYYYKIQAFDAQRNYSNFSATTTVKTSPSGQSQVIDLQSPVVPTGLIATPVSSSQIKLSWTASTDNVGVVGYRVYRNRVFIATSSDVNFYNVGLSPAMTYYYNVSAFDAARNFSAISATSSVKTLSSNATTSMATSSPLVKTNVLIGANSATVEAVTSAESEPLPNISSRIELNSVCKTVYEKVVSVATSTENVNRYAIASFIQNGTDTTKILGAGERGGVIGSFYSTFSRLPINQDDWQDVIKIANGRWPKQRNTNLEEIKKTNVFKKIYLRSPNMANANDNAAVTILTYGLRPANRSVINEAASIKTFKAIYGRTPSAAADWDIVRAIAYSGAKR